MWGYSWSGEAISLISVHCEEQVAKHDAEFCDATHLFEVEQIGG